MPLEGLDESHELFLLASLAWEGESEDTMGSTYKRREVQQSGVSISKFTRQTQEVQEASSPDCAGALIALLLMSKGA
jgi:hypothetical protein